jgi:hypothetical protein
LKGGVSAAAQTLRSLNGRSSGGKIYNNEVRNGEVDVGWRKHTITSEQQLDGRGTMVRH